MAPKTSRAKSSNEVPSNTQSSAVDDIDDNFIYHLVQCSSDNCPVWTKIGAPKDFDLNQEFRCGFCSAKTNLQPPPKSFAAALTESLRTQSSECSNIVKELRLEEKRIESRALNVIVSGTKPVPDVSDYDLFSEIAEEIGVTVTDSDLELKRIGKADNLNRQLLLIKLSSAILRKQILQGATKLRLNNNFKDIYVQPDRTKSEREAQFKLREEKRAKIRDNPGKEFIIKDGQVTEKK